MKPRQMLVSSEKYALKCPYPMTAEFIVVHNTANDASANNEISYMRTNNTSTSFHFAIDDKEVVQGLPLNRNGFHAGDGSNGRGNRKGIGIEICYSKSGGARFIQAEKNAAKFIAQLLKERNWGIDKVKKHQDFSGKYCPHRTLDLGWQRFLKMVENELRTLNNKPVWRPMITPRQMRAKADTDLIDLNTLKSVKAVKKHTLLDLDQTTDWKGKSYVRTEYSSKHGIDNGILITAVENIPEKPTPEPIPEPPVEPVDPEPPLFPIEPPITPEPDPEGFRKLLDWLISIIKRILGRK